MHWHAQPTSLTLRAYAQPDGYAQRVPFDACMQVEFLGADVVYIHAALKVDGSELSLTDWREMSRLLQAQYGVKTIMAHRRGRLKTWPAEAIGRPGPC